MKYSVLIIEDDPMVSLINSQYVAKHKDFTVSATCRNGEEALAFLKDKTVDLILLDVFMPVMDGIQTLLAIRKQNISSDVIMVTAANNSSTIEETMHLGVIDYLIKPFTLERFMLALDKFISKRTLMQHEVMDQSSLDKIILSGQQNSHSVTEEENNDSLKSETHFPKGIQKKTLSLIEHYFAQHPGWSTADMIADETGVSIVTVRTYMNYLLNKKQITQELNYNTGGRPRVLFKAIK